MNILTVESLIEEGNTSFKNGNQTRAIECYSHAIEQSNNTSSRAYSNRSAIFLKQDIYYKAFTDAQKSLALDNSNLKGHFRAGKSAYSMRQFQTAKIHFESCLNLDPQNCEAQTELDKTKQRLLESTTGMYDLAAVKQEILSRVHKRESLNFDFADFVSSQILIIDIDDIKNKGIKANEFIKRGTLLCASKALSAIFKYTSAGNLEFTNITHDLLAKLSFDPYLREQFCSLYPRQVQIDDHQDSLDPELFRSIYKYNLFNIDLNRLFKDTGASGQENQVTGLWHVPSFFNHSCMPNAFIHFLGDMAFVIAKRDIEKSEEVTLSYFGCNLYFTFDQRMEYIKNYEFVCSCKLCQVDRGDENLQKREILIETLKVKSFRSMSLKEALDDVKLMEDTYLRRPHLQHGMYWALMNLARRYRFEKRFKKSAQTFERIYEVAEEGCEESFLMSMLFHAYSDYSQCFESKKTKVCKRKAQEFYGELQKSYFEMRWSEFA
jgi:tetratricopeptide (TPR) repeat protein